MSFTEGLLSVCITTLEETEGDVNINNVLLLLASAGS